MYLFPAICVISLVLRVEGRLNGRGTTHTARIGERCCWMIGRSAVPTWIVGWSTSPRPSWCLSGICAGTNVSFEWVYNHADIMQSHVIWARDLGADHDKLLLNLLPDRTAWLLDADVANPQLVPFADGINAPPPKSPYGPPRSGSEQDEQNNW